MLLTLSHRPLFARRLVWAWACALLLAPLWGLAHRVVHAAPAVQGEQAGKLFATHDAGSDECRLYDQLLNADGAAVASKPTLGALPKLASPLAAAIALAGRTVCEYRARAPPR